jgi:hypothetical protein
MKKSFVISQIYTLIFAFSVIVKAQTTPNENALKRHYPSVYRNWTDQLSWSSVTVATEVEGLIKSQNVVDSLKLNQTMDKISKQQGGVLFFPKGTYFINFNVVLPEGVIVRGETIEQIESGRIILSRWEFPKYTIKSTLKAQYNTQTKNYESSDVRRITISSNSKGNIGIVDLDINRGLIDIQSSGNQIIKNILILNIAQNNVAIADVRVPSVYQIANARLFQRWPQKDIPNLKIVADNNVIIANSRFNEKVTDNIPQMKYLTDDGMTFDAFEAVFKFTDHIGIILELNKTGRNSSLVDNFICVTEGNLFFQTKGVGLFEKRNDFKYIREKQNLVNDGLYTKDSNFAIKIKNNSRFLKDTFFSKFGDTLAYSLIKPEIVETNNILFDLDAYDNSLAKPQIEKTLSKYPLVVFLETGSPQNATNGDQLKQFPWQITDENNSTQFPCFTLAPMLPKSETWWKSKAFSSTSWSLRTVIQIIDSLVVKYPIDKDRIYLVGVGIGATGAWDLAQRYPQKFAALVPIASFYRFVPNSAAQLRDVPIWMIWGALDEFIPITTKQFMKYELKGAGVKYQHTEIPGTGNRCWTTIDKTVPNLFSWMFQQQRK